MRVWIDFANAPHVAFFAPVIDQLRSSGHQTFITLRDFAGTIKIAKRFGIEGTVVGSHGGRTYIGKGANFLTRSLALVRTARPWHADVAVSHNSYTHVMAAKMLGIPTVTIMDYEGQPANHVAFRLADRIVVPECFPSEALRHFGAIDRKIYRYQGFKEQLYLSGHTPSRTLVRELADSCGLLEDWSLDRNVLVVLRTPPDYAMYHRFKNVLFRVLMARLNDEAAAVTTIVLPRSDEQGREVARQYPNLKLPRYPLDGRDLVCLADMVISAGGTMNREAAILGTPAYSLFAGVSASVDRRLQEMGRMHVLSSEQDIRAVVLQKKRHVEVLTNHRLCDEVCAVITQGAHVGNGHRP